MPRTLLLRLLSQLVENLLFVMRQDPDMLHLSRPMLVPQLRRLLRIRQLMRSPALLVTVCSFAALNNDVE